MNIYSDSVILGIGPSRLKNLEQLVIANENSCVNSRNPGLHPRMRRIGLNGGGKRDVPNYQSNGIDSDEPCGKDETEVELEKFVFGDDTGFYQGLKSYGTKNPTHGAQSGEKSRAGSQVDIGEDVLGGVEDADVGTLTCPRR